MLRATLYILLCSVAWSVTAQDIPAENIRFHIDYAGFRGHKDKVYLEVYISVQRSDLNYILTEDNRYQAEFKVSAEATLEDNVADHKEWSNTNITDSLSQVLGTQHLFTIGVFELVKGTYSWNVRISDANSERDGEAKFELGIQTFPDTGLCLSDIQFASNLSADTSSSQFTKNNVKVIPNPSAMYGTTLPMLYFYIEAYNLAFAAGEEPSFYTIKYSVFDGSGQKVKEWPVRKKQKPGDSAVEVGGVNIISLKSGTYFLVLEVEDLKSNEKTFAQKKFFIFREGEEFAAGEVKIAEGAGSPGIDADRYDIMSEQELDEEFEPTKYFNTAEERKIWASLKLEEKREYIKRFWAQRDPTPDSAENEFKRSFLSRVEAANRVFTGFRTGWKTDRGRVLLQYGTPDEIERFPFSIDANEYHIWHYYSIQGGVYFVFVKKHEAGQLELVHSTAQGELYDIDWQRWLLRGN